MDEVASHVRGRRILTILDLGCGTGRFSDALAKCFEADVVGVDPSKKMLAEAQRKPHGRRVRYARGRGEAIPLADRSADLVFMSMVFHHFDAPQLVAGECYRVLQDDGVVFLRAGTADQIQSYPYVEFFPSTPSILEQRLPTNAVIRQAFEAVGFRTHTFGLITQQIAPNHAAYADKLAAGADSVLASVSHEELDAGLAAIRSRTVDGEAGIVEPIDFFVFR